MNYQWWPGRGWEDWAVITPPPRPPATLWPGRTRPEVVVDTWRVMLADPEGNLIGFDAQWGRGAQIARIAYAQRTEGTRIL
jgi:hypothetical protein